MIIFGTAISTVNIESIHEKLKTPVEISEKLPDYKILQLKTKKSFLESVRFIELPEICGFVVRDTIADLHLRDEVKGSLEIPPTPCEDDKTLAADHFREIVKSKKKYKKLKKSKISQYIMWGGYKHWLLTQNLNNAIFTLEVGGWITAWDYIATKTIRPSLRLYAVSQPPL